MSKWKWVTPRWPAVLIGMSALGVAVLVGRLLEALTTAEAINIFLIGSLVFVTSVYAAETAEMRNIMQKQRRDSQKPLITAQEDCYRIAPFSRRAERDTLNLWIKNIGVGPATNITIRVEQRSSRKTVTRLDNTMTSVFPLGVGHHAFVYHSKDDKSITITKDEWLVISYDDIFGNSFETECQWNGWTWHRFKTKPVD